MATPTGQLTFEPVSLTPYLTLRGKGNSSPDPQQLSEELPEGGEGCHGDAHHPPQPLGGALEEVYGVNGEADACRRKKRRCESIGINEWGTDGLMNLRQKWRLIIFVVKGGGGPGVMATPISEGIDEGKRRSPQVDLS